MAMSSGLLYKVRETLMEVPDMANHSGCFLCGGGENEILTSIPLMFKMHSIAVCSKCHKLPGEEIKRQVVALEDAQLAARKAARQGI